MSPPISSNPYRVEKYRYNTRDRPVKRRRQALLIKQFSSETIAPYSNY